MTIKIPVHAQYEKNGGVTLTPASRSDNVLVSKLFSKKQEWEERNGKEFILQASLELNYQKRTYKQNNTVWALVSIIFQSDSENNRPPTNEEKTRLYYDLLEVYADKTPNKITGALRPVHISESNSAEGARFIDSLLYHLAAQCDLDYTAQASVIDIIQQWEEWRGRLDVDPLDYSDPAYTRLLTEQEWRKRHPYSEASGRGGQIFRAHIVSRGADHPDIEMTWNWISLLWDEHQQQHQIGRDAFLQIYPHLRGRVDRARRLAGKLDLDFRAAQKAIDYKPENLALEALKDESSENDTWDGNGYDSWAWSELHDTD
jgi:hypothetical protein